MFCYNHRSQKKNEDKNKNKDKGNKQKTLMNMVDII